MNSENIAIYSEALNLRSWQAARLNFLFLLCQDLDLAAVFRQLIPGLQG